VRGFSDFRFVKLIHEVFMVKEPITEPEYQYTIEEPIMEELFEPAIEESPTGRGYNTTFEQRKAAAEHARREGLEKGAVVVELAKSEWQRTEPINWGIVMETAGWIHGGGDYFAPIRVKWLDSSVDCYYPDELIVVNYAPDDIELGQIKRGET
jgi:hypothetical protein